MQICRELAGYSYGRADIVRRAMSKKKHDVMLKERENFVHGTVDESGNIICEGAVRRGVPEDIANEIFDEMMSFASYAFNKAHAAAYAFVAYRTAWLKCHYPCEFMASIMTSFLDNTGKVVQYINECSKIGIKLLPPHINLSSGSFSASDGNIHYSLLAVKNLGRSFINKIVEEREKNGDFSGFYEFCKRMQGRELNRRAVESLIKCGAFDGLSANRKQMLSVIDSIIDDLDNERKRNVDGQIGFFDLDSEDENEEINETFVYPETEEFPDELLLKYEKEVSGMYLSGHPMRKYEKLSRNLKCALINDIISEDNCRYKDNDRVKLLVLISSVRKKITKSDTTMAFAVVEDNTGSIETIVFPKILAEHPSLFSEGNIVLIGGRISMREDEDTKIVCESISPCPPENSFAEEEKPAENQEKKKASGLFLRFDTESSPQIKYCERLLSIFDGSVPLYYYFNDTKEYKRNPIGTGIDVNDVLLRELKKILGESNVIYNKR